MHKQMRILIVGRCDGWMGVHLSQFSNGFRILGHEVRLVDYHIWDKKKFPWLGFEDPDTARMHRQTTGLKQTLLEYKPHMTLLIPAHQMFNLDIVREIYSGLIIFYDMDGQQSDIYSSGLAWIDQIDLLLTVSKVTADRIFPAKQNKIYYLPHGVDTDYYRPIPLTNEEKARYYSPVAFVGRPSERRVRYLETIAGQGLVVWGKRWAKRPFSDNPLLRPCIREKTNIIGDNLVRLYRSTTVMVNILRETPIESPSIMSIQVFSIPSTGTCFLTEWVEELEDSFDPGCEILAFKSIEDFKETASRLIGEPSVAAKIGEAGRRRCLAHHTHKQRAEEILGIVGLG